ncbi:AMI protease, partial [Polypterus senegalus]
MLELKQEWQQANKTKRQELQQANETQRLMLQQAMERLRKEMQVEMRQVLGKIETLTDQLEDLKETFMTRIELAENLATSAEEKAESVSSECKKLGDRLAALEDGSRREMFVVLGAHNIRENEQSQVIIKAKRIIPHPEYLMNEVKNDIMLLELEKNVTLNENIKPIPLPTTITDLCDGTNCLASGWGIFSQEGTKISDTLQEASIQVVKRYCCKQKWGKVINKKMFCTQEVGCILPECPECGVQPGHRQADMLVHHTRVYLQSLYLQKVHKPSAAAPITPYSPGRSTMPCTVLRPPPLLSSELRPLPPDSCPDSPKSRAHSLCAFLAASCPLSPVQSCYLPTSTNDWREAAPFMGTRMGSSCFPALNVGHTLCGGSAAAPEAVRVSRSSSPALPGVAEVPGSRDKQALGRRLAVATGPYRLPSPLPEASCITRTDALSRSGGGTRPPPVFQGVPAGLHPRPKTTRGKPASGRRLAVTTGPYRAGLPSPVPVVPNITRTDAPSRSGGGTSPPLLLLGVPAGLQPRPGTTRVIQLYFLIGLFSLKQNSQAGGKMAVLKAWRGSDIIRAGTRSDFIMTGSNIVKGTRTGHDVVGTGSNIIKGAGPNTSNPTSTQNPRK